jgi:hypothetical protein
MGKNGAAFTVIAGRSRIRLVESVYVFFTGLVFVRGFFHFAPPCFLAIDQKQFVSTITLRPTRKKADAKPFVSA